MSSIVGPGLADLHQTRDEVVAEVRKAPQRRIDNVITHLHDSIHLLFVHALVAQDVQQRYSRAQWDNRMQEAGSLLMGVGIAALGGGYFHLWPVEFTGGVVVATALGVGGLHFFNTRQLARYEEQLVTPEELSASFQRTHSKEIRAADEFTASLWQRVRDPLRHALKTVGLANFPSVSKKELAELEQILNDDIPRLRRLASRNHSAPGGGG